MAKRKNKQTGGDDDLMIEAVEVSEYSGGLDSEKNQKILFAVLGVLILAVGGYFLYQNIIVKPKTGIAIEQMYKAQEQFESDSFKLALTNPGEGYPGFLEIIDNYGGTPVGNLANYYTGISYLHLGQYEAAIDYLKTYTPDDDVTPAMKYGAMGDAYAEMNDLDNALALYKKALDNSTNDVSTPYYLKKLGMFYEYQQQYAEAKKMYERIKNEYPKSMFATEIDKYLMRVASKG